MPQCPTLAPVPGDIFISDLGRYKGAGKLVTCFVDSTWRRPVTFHKTPKILRCLRNVPFLA